MDIKAISSTEISKPSATENKSFDPDKRIDVNQKQDTKESAGYDVDKRVDVAENSGVEQLKCLNEDLAGDVHPKTGVAFERKVVDLGDKKVEGVFPVLTAITMFSSQKNCLLKVTLNSLRSAINSLKTHWKEILLYVKNLLMTKLSRLWMEKRQMVKYGIIMKK